ncbi:MAG: hypothetical protein K2Q20_03195, partial [Phycisphaerales bacterium]|nr:hypothetical protein [Phycisphaerales bacterium]
MASPAGSSPPREHAASGSKASTPIISSFVIVHLLDSASRARAEKSVQFLTSETWRAYISCYV